MLPSVSLLVVAAEPVACTIATLLDDAEPWSAEPVASPAAALELLRAQPYAAVLLEHALVGEQLSPLIADARARGCHAPFVVLTTETEPAAQRRLLDSGAADYLALATLDRDRLDRALRYARSLAAHQASEASLQRRLHEVVSISGESHWLMASRTPVPIDLPEELQIARFYADGYMVEADDASARARGFSHAAELLGAPLEKLLPPTDPENIAALRAFIRSDYRLERTRLVNRGPGQPPIYFHTHWQGHIENGHLHHVAGSQHDITAQYTAESRLAELAAIVESSQQAIVSTDADGTIRTWNRGAEQLYGWTAAEAIGQSMLLLVPTQEHESTFAAFAELTSSGSPVSYEAPLLHKDGYLLDVSVTVSPLHDATGQPTGIAAIARDVSEIRLTAARLAESEQRFRNVLTHSREAIYQFNIVTQQYDYASPSFEQVLGFTPAEVAASGLDFLQSRIHPEDLERLLCELTPQPQTPNVATDNTLEYRFLTAHRGWRWLSNSFRTLHDAAGQPYLTVGSLWDVTEQREMYRQVHESERRLLHAQAIAHLGSWESDMATETTRISDELCRIFGIAPTAEGVPFQQILAYVHPADLDCAKQFIADLSASGVALADLRILRADAEVRHVSLQAQAVFSADSQLERVVGTALDITERKLAEQALHVSEINLRAIFDSSREGITLIDRGYRIKAFNRRAAMDAGTIFGKEMAVGQSVLEFISPDDAATFRQLFDQAFAGERQTLVAPLPGPNGSSWWELGYYPVTAEDGTIASVVFSVADISERKLAQDALERSEKLYHTLASNFPNGTVYLIDATSRILLAEGQGMSIIGLSPELVKGRTLLEVFGSSPAYADLLQVFRCAMRGEQGFVETCYNGHWRAVRTVPVRDEHGAVVAVMAMTQDTTERKQAEEALRESERRLKNAQRIAHLGNWEWNVDARRNIWSEELYHIFGLAPDTADISASAMRRLIHPDDYEQLSAALPLLERGDRFEQELRIVRPSGDVRFIAVRGEPLAQPDGHISRIVGTALDITDLKLAEAELQRAHDELEARVEARTLELVAAKEEAERANAAKSEFLSRMSHELRTPMNSILGFAQIMEMDALTERQGERVGFIMKAGQHLLRLINEVLDLARVESGRLDVSPEPVLLARTAAGAAELIRPQLEQRRQQLVLSCEDAEWLYVQADQQRLAQVLLNLLSNASKYSGAGTTITVTSQRSSAGRVRLTVADAGPGIAPEHRPKLFIPFERLGAASSVIEGTGLGLALSKRLIELMGGTIGVDSEPGAGSRFWIELPSVAQPVQDLGDTTLDMPIAELEQSHTVLYVEDNLANLEVIQHVLGLQPHIQLLSALQGQIGFELAVQHRPSLILLDYHLPDIKGDEVLRRLRGHPATQHIPVMMISADATPSQMRRAIAAGATEYLTKPLDVRLFVTRVTELLRAAPAPLLSERP